VPVSLLLVVTCACTGADPGHSSADRNDLTQAAVVAGGRSDQLVIGGLMPRTGVMAEIDPPQEAGLQAAVADVNAAGGVLGKPIVLDIRDIGDASTDTAQVSVRDLLAENVGAVVPGGTSSITFGVIDSLVGAGVVMMSPVNTNVELTSYPDHGLFWRDVAPDQLQGEALAQEALADGARTMAAIWDGGSYGEAIAGSAEDAFVAEGGVFYGGAFEPTVDGMKEAVTRLKRLDSDALMIAGYESLQLMQEMLRQGLLPQRASGKRVYFSDAGVFDVGDELPPTMLVGVKGAIPGAEPSRAFVSELRLINAELANGVNGPEAYDAVILLSLAAEAARSGKGHAIAGQLRAVSSGGERCKTFAQCKQMLDAGQDIDYDGLTGPVTFDAHGDPAVATIGIFSYDRANHYRAVGYRTSRR
jgi:branched-chain amino acid transport system substrate-binding protein